MFQDLRYAWRVLCKSPGFAAVVILTLMLGIGANTAVFSILRGALLQPLPYRDPDRLVDVLDANVRDPNLAKTFGTYSDFEEYSRHARSFEKIAFATWVTGGATLTGHGPAKNILAIPVSEDFFSMLGVTAVRGRTFEHADLSRGCSVVLSDRFWRDSLAADTSIVGRPLTLNNRACTVLGVMPVRFEFYPRRTQLWMLLTPDDPRPRDRLLAITFARLKHGVTIAQARAELAPLHKEIHKSDWQRDFTPSVNNLQDEFTFLAGRNIRSTLWLLVGAVALVLLVACLNVANLLLGRCALRAREFAVRAALGSGRARLIRQSLVEALLLALAGGGTGVLLAVALVRYFLHANPIELPIGSDVSLNAPVLAFTLLLAVATALVFGIAPALASSRADAGTGLSAAGRGSIQGANHGLTRVLIAAEISLSLMLVAGAGLLMRSVLNMSTAPLGYDPDHVMVTNTTLSEQRYAGSAAKLRFYDDLLRKLNASPGSDSAAIATAVPPYGSGNYEIQIEGRGRTGVQDVGQNPVSADYFRVLRIALRRGRVFDHRDAANSQPVAVVNEALAREYFPGADPVGQRLRAFGFTEGPWVTIVGVVANEKHPEWMHEMAWREQAAFYRPIEQEPSAAIWIALRTRGGAFDTRHAMERALTEIDASIPVGEVSTVRGLLGNSLKYPEFRAVVLDQFAALALVLAALGLHGLLSQYVSQRSRELGLRMAVGASARDIVRLVGVQAGIPVLAGVSAGIALTFGLSRYLTSLLFGITPADPATMIAASLVLMAAACVAMVRPALNAASVDPGTALRDE